ncbi:hypothetical protein ACFX2I_016777 [Malus domestica]
MDSGKEDEGWLCSNGDSAGGHREIMFNGDLAHQKNSYSYPYKASWTDPGKRCAETFLENRFSKGIFHVEIFLVETYGVIHMFRYGGIL